MGESNTADRLKEALKIRGMKQIELSEKSGIGKSSISTYLTGSYIPKQHNLFKLASALNVSEAWLMGHNVPMEREKPIQIQKSDNETQSDSLPDGAVPYNPTKRIPVLGRVAAGLPLYASENIEGYIWTERNHGGEYFALRIKGDSMNAVRIYDGDIIIVKKQDIVENGTVAVVMVDGDEATVKRFYQSGRQVTLVPASTNPEHQPQIYDLKNTTISIVGQVVESRTTVL